MITIKNGDTVTVHYTGKFDDGSIFDTSKQEGREPLVSELGKGNLIPGFESALIGMKEGDTKTVTIESSDAYGDYRDDYVIEVSLSNLPPNVSEGTYLNANSPQGPMQVLVKGITGDKALLDHNHPLAGKRLTFDLEVLSFSSVETVS